MKTILFFLSATLAFCSTLDLGSFPHTKVEGETRVWTSKSGQTIKAEAKTLEGKSIQILRSDGRFFWVDFKDLSDEDILYLKKILPAPFTIFEAVPNARHDELKIRLENRGIGIILIKYTAGNLQPIIKKYILIKNCFLGI